MVVEIAILKKTGNNFKELILMNIEKINPKIKLNISKIKESFRNKKHEKNKSNRQSKIFG